MTGLQLTHAAILVLAAAASWALTLVAERWMSASGVIDAPEARRSHTIPTPRGGGLGFVLVFLAVLLILRPTSLWWLALVSIALIAALGLLEDLKSLPAAVRLAVQVIVLAGTVFLCLRSSGSGSVGDLPAALILLTFAAVWLVNLYNFMDGIDGLAAWEGVFAAGLLGAMSARAGDLELALACWALAAAVLGFVPRNWPRARVFMGDVGATMLGAAFAIIGLLGLVRGSLPLLAVPIVLAVFIVDATATLSARILGGERWYTAHRRHTYQRLAERGVPHHGVVSGYMLINLAVVTPVAWLTQGSGEIQLAAAIAVYAVLTLAWWIARNR